MADGTPADHWITDMSGEGTGLYFGSFSPGKSDSIVFQAKIINDGGVAVDFEKPFETVALAFTPNEGTQRATASVSIDLGSM